MMPNFHSLLLGVWVVLGSSGCLLGGTLDPGGKDPASIDDVSAYVPGDCPAQAEGEANCPAPSQLRCAADDSGCQRCHCGP